MKRRINLSLHWKSYFINLIWKCKAVWNAGFSLTFLLNMYESRISWCVTLVIPGFFPGRFTQVSLLVVSDYRGVGCLPWTLGSFSIVSCTWPPGDSWAILPREEKDLLLSALLPPLWVLFVYKCCLYLGPTNRMGQRLWKKPQGSFSELEPSKVFSKCSVYISWLKQMT